ncbi:MAG: diguanylate phosphodiesterase [Rhodobacteraceae bacterium]|uniref:EAL domain-containing protein n=1 Tax=Cypionkella sp. TaxID=2811411 RepID=UPI001325C692|nr:EAL domain-containing protein [Cypionkella sp.]KAF0174061.1 MAG: diguanylate phosphodiesterase [Paracoccaceae bacterium]MDO8326905.1 EAL domain-containing protein [Cypionkella sp.]
MMIERSKPRIDDRAGLASPLGVAISEGDRATLAMVRQAIDTKRLRLAYQPVVLARDPARIAFYEGLIRVLDPAGRVIPAKDFMDAVESHEIGREIDCAALEIGMAALARHADLRLSVNMSARSIGYPRWMRVLRRGLSVAPTIGERLILEITESSAMLVPEIVVAFMDDLKGDGIAFALDDFGSGYTAIRYFKDFFFDILKIDGQFIRNIQTDADNQALTAALLSIGKHFHMFTVAEAVETAAEAEVLRSMGVDCLQGFLFGAATLKPAFLPEMSRKSA